MIGKTRNVLKVNINHYHYVLGIEDFLNKIPKAVLIKKMLISSTVLK